MLDDGTRRLLEDALGHLQRYRGLLLESRSGAASGREQEALAVGRLAAAIEQVLTSPAADRRSSQ